MNIRPRLLSGTDRLLAGLLATLVLGTTLAFGGAVWWARPAIAVLTFLFVLGWLAHVMLEGEMRVLKSPLNFLGFAALALAVVQLVPLPSRLARPVSPHAREVYTFGVLPERALADDPSLQLPEPAEARTPASLDRAATLRWLAGATVCLVLFWGTSQFTDRLRRLYVVWGSIVAAFSLNTVFALVQLVSRSRGLYGVIEPGKGPMWAPSVEDLLTSPNAAVLRSVGSTSGSAHLAWASLLPDRPFLIGSLMGGQGAYLALGSIGLPLALALTLQLLAPRGSREGVAARLGQSGQGGLVVLLSVLLIVSAVLVGLMAGPLLALPFAIGLALVGLPSAWPSGLRWSAVGLTLAALISLAAGAVTGDIWSRIPGANPPVVAEDLKTSATVWADSLPIVRDFPVIGTGLGSFGSIYPFYKSRDHAPTTALSSLLQWAVESGAVGVVLLGLAILWCLVRLPGAIKRVGTADRPLVFGLIGAAVAFFLFSAVHWTVELAAVAIAASALGGTWNRWLAGGTDLFVEVG